MRWLARFCENNSGAILIVVGLVSIACLFPLPLGYDDDVVRFLPEGDPEVERLMGIADRFGSIHVALVGIEAPDLFAPDALAYVRQLHAKLDALDVVKAVTSLTELAVIESDESGGTLHRAVVPHPIPDGAAALSELKRSVLRLDYLVGSLVSEDGTSTRLVVQLEVEQEGERVSTKVAAERLREVVDSLARPESVRIHYGGAPFIAEAAANGSQADLERLAPWVCLIIVLLIFLSLGSIRAALLALGTVGLGILWTMGIMGALGSPLTLVSTSLPVILVALGSAYAVHLLVWAMDHQDGVEGMLVQVGWPVAIAAATTVAGFLSFLVMDLPPMREFGWQMALGTGICALLAMTVIPAALSRWPLEARASVKISEAIDDLLVALAESSRRHRWPVVVGLLATALFFGRQLPNIATRMDTKSFFEEGSAPEQADVFMSEQFGGAVFLQILVDGDVRDPAFLRALADFEDHIDAVPGVTAVQSITQVLGLVNQAVGDGRRHLAQNRAATSQHGFLAETSDKAVRLLVDPEWTGALIQVAIGGFDTEIVRRVTRDIRHLAKTRLPSAVAVVKRSDVPPEVADAVVRQAAERIALLVRGVASSEPDVDALYRALKGGDGPAADLQKIVRKVLEDEIVEEEMILVKDDADLDAFAKGAADALARGALTLEGFRSLADAVASEDEQDDLEAYGKGVKYVFDRVREAGAQRVVAPILKAVEAQVGDLKERLKHRVRGIVYDVTGPWWHVDVALLETQAASAVSRVRTVPLAAQVSGYPVVQEAMTRSVHHNQVASLLTSLPLVLLILVVVFRSLYAGLVGMLPTGLTLLVTFGLMGLFPQRLPLDIGSSMLASIALGVGIDYAIHFLWRYRDSGLEGAMRNTGRAIVINALEITAGFVVLVEASIVPMSNFGLLVAETLAVAAIATLLLMPALVEWWKPAGQAVRETSK